MAGRTPPLQTVPVLPDEALRMAGVPGFGGDAPRNGTRTNANQAAPVDSVEEPSDLWLALTAIPRPHRLVDFPRDAPDGMAIGQVAMWPLTQEEQMCCNAEADRYTKALLKDPVKKDEASLGYAHTYTNETAIQVLYRACRDPKDITKAAFPSPKLMRMRLTTDEVGVLFNRYCTIQLELGPIIAYMSDEEREGMILKLHKGGSMSPFDSLSWEQQKNLVSFLVSQVVSYWTATCFAGQPLDVGFTTRQALDDMANEIRLRMDEDAKVVAAMAAIPDPDQDPVPDATTEDTTTQADDQPTE